MISDRLRCCSLLSIGAMLALTAPAQGLRDAVASAPTVVVATDIGVRPAKDHLLHRLRVEQTLRGEAREFVSVVEWKELALHARPRPAERRLYCLTPLPQQAAERLPGAYAPYFEMSALPQANPAVGATPDADPHVRLAKVVIAAEAGAAPAAQTIELVALALAPQAGARTEAVRLLTERSSLRDALTPVQWGSLLMRAVGETDDIEHKIALAELCAEQRLPGLVDSLVVAVESVDDERFLASLGRIARYLHGEDAIDTLRPHLQRPQRQETRDRLLRVLGETRTERALLALLRMRDLDRDDAAVEAALRANGTTRALEALARK